MFLVLDIDADMEHVGLAELRHQFLGRLTIADMEFVHRREIIDRDGISRLAPLGEVTYSLFCARPGAWS